MREAIRLAAEQVNRGGGPFGVVVVKDGNIIARGANRVTGDKDPTAHAEIIAIRAACKVLDTHDLTGCEIYCSCEPCPMCLGAIYWARLKKVYFAATREDAGNAGFDDDIIYRELSKPLKNRKIPFIQMMREEAQIPFENWRNNPDRTEY